MPADRDAMAPWWQRLLLPLLCLLSLGMMVLSWLVYQIETGLGGSPSLPLTHAWMYLFRAPEVAARSLGLWQLARLMVVVTPLFYGVLWWSAWRMCALFWRAPAEA